MYSRSKSQPADLARPCFNSRVLIARAQERGEPTRENEWSHFCSWFTVCVRVIHCVWCGSPLSCGVSSSREFEYSSRSRAISLAVQDCLWTTRGTRVRVYTPARRKLEAGQYGDWVRPNQNSPDIPCRAGAKSAGRRAEESYARRGERLAGHDRRLLVSVYRAYSSL